MHTSGVSNLESERASIRADVAPNDIYGLFNGGRYSLINAVGIYWFAGPERIGRGLDAVLEVLVSLLVTLPLYWSKVTAFHLLKFDNGSAFDREIALEIATSPPV
jgi:hypothetical protein